MRLGGHVRQFGNDLFLLRKIERHCFLRTGLVARSCAREPLSDYGSVFLRIRRHLSMPTWWPFQENLSGLHHLRRLVRFETVARCAPGIPSLCSASVLPETHRIVACGL